MKERKIYIPDRFKIIYNDKLNAYVTDPKVEVPGLSYFPNFINEEEEKEILNHIDRQPFEKVIRRRQQFYGERYYHTRHNLTAIQPSSMEGTLDCLDMTSFNWIVDRINKLEKDSSTIIFGPNPDLQPTQVLMNEYTGPVGIANHFDDDNAFGEVIVTLSLINPVWMNLTLPRIPVNHCLDILESQRILLEPRSLLVMRDDSRFKWRHGISKTRFIYLPSDSETASNDLRYRWYLPFSANPGTRHDTNTLKKSHYFKENENINTTVNVPENAFYRDDNFRRISLTIRKLLSGRKRCKEDSTEWVDD